MEHKNTYRSIFNHHQISTPSGPPYPYMKVWCLTIPPLFCTSYMDIYMFIYGTYGPLFTNQKQTHIKAIVITDNFVRKIILLAKLHTKQLMPIVRHIS